MEISFTHIFVILSFISMGIILSLIAKKYLSSQNAALYISLIFAPILIYLIITGQIIELKGYGFEAKFEKIATKNISPSSTEVIKPSSPSAIDLLGDAESNAMWGKGVEVVLIKVSPPERNEEEIKADVLNKARQIYPSLLQGTLQFVVIMDDFNRVLGYFEKEFFYDLLRIEVEQVLRGKREKYEVEKVIEQLQQTNLWSIVQYPKIKANDWGLKKTIRLSASNIEALKLMDKEKQYAIVVVDNESKYNGIVKKNEIVSEIILNLFKNE